MSGIWKKTDTLKERFERAVIKKDGCWEWYGPMYVNGYGNITFQNKRILAHRVSYLLHKGAVEDHLLICHTCDNRVCTNPEHLFKGTHKDNLSDMAQKGRSSRGQKNGRSKLSDADVKIIKKMIKSKKFLHRDIANKFSVCRPLISLIANNKNWKHI